MAITTYEQLLEHLLKAGDEVLDQDITAYIDGEYIPCTFTYTKEKECDVLDNGHLVITEWFSKFKVGDRVAYSVQFLRSIDMLNSSISHGRGIITELRMIAKDLVLAVIEWQNEDLPNVVNVKNLAKVGPNSGFCKT